jgi:dTDP-4-amino-4,6-dideoxygalactose transaminase
MLLDAHMKDQTVIRLSKSTIGEEEKEAVKQVLEREFLGMGHDVLCFEQELSIFFSSPAVCVASGTAALQLALESVGIGRGDEVLVPSLTYVASYQAISATGAIPVSCDVYPNTLTIDIEDAELRRTSKTKAIMPVHYSGGVGNLGLVYKMADRCGLRVIEDAAHAFGSKYQGKLVGSFGDIACFSFDGIKNITSGEGGCIVTRDENILSKIRDARLLGVEKDSESRYRGTRTWNFDVKAQGWRYHMSNIMAAIGIEQLNKFPKAQQTRQALAKKYDQELIGVEGIRLIKHDYDQVVPHIYVIMVDGMTIEKREKIQSEMLEMKIQTGFHYQPNHYLTFYENLNARDLVVTDEIYPNLITLPLHLDLTSDDVKYVCDSLKKIVTNYCHY